MSNLRYLIRMKVYPFYNLYSGSRDNTPPPKTP